jgi:hypothetical protein
MSGIKIIDFADDVITNKREVGERSGKYSEQKTKKVSRWAKENKVRFNDQKSKVMLMTRRKRKERKDVEVY